MLPLAYRRLEDSFLAPGRSAPCAPWACRSLVTGGSGLGPRTRGRPAGRLHRHAWPDTWVDRRRRRRLAPHGRLLRAAPGVACPPAAAAAAGPLPGLARPPDGPTALRRPAVSECAPRARAVPGLGPAVVDRRPVAAVAGRWKSRAARPWSPECTAEASSARRRGVGPAVAGPARPAVVRLARRSPRRSRRRRRRPVPATGDGGRYCGPGAARARATGWPRPAGRRSGSTTPGMGDSVGTWTDHGLVAEWLRGIRAPSTTPAASALPRVAVVGLRLGATLAAAELAHGGGVDDLVLWDPCAKGKAFLREQRAHVDVPARPRPPSGARSARTSSGARAGRPRTGRSRRPA